MICKRSDTSTSSPASEASRLQRSVSGPTSSTPSVTTNHSRRKSSKNTGRKQEYTGILKHYGPPAQQTLSPEDSPASHSVAPGSAEAIRMTVTSGRKCSESFETPVPLGLLQKTLLESSRWSSTRCSLTWKATATPAGRLLFRLAPSTHRTGETESGLWPTLTASDSKGPALHRIRVGREGPKLCEVILGVGTDLRLQPSFAEWYMGYPHDWTKLKESTLSAMRSARRLLRK